MALQAVSFGKKPPKAARLAPKKKPHRTGWDWSEDELQVLRDFYSTKGPAFCKSKLPKRSMSGIYGMAGQLGLKSAKTSKRGKPLVRRGAGPDLDARIKAEWPLLKGRGAVRKLAEKLKIPRYYLCNRALALGLQVPRKEPPWSEPERKLLEKYATRLPDHISRIFREHGYSRSPASIKIKLVRWKIDREDPWNLTSRAAAEILGIDSHAITAAVLEGRLKGERRGSTGLAAVGRDHWVIPRAAFRQYVIDNIDTIDIRKVDKLRFVDLLIKPAEPPAGPT